MNANKQHIIRKLVIVAVVLSIIAGQALTNLHGYVRATRGVAVGNERAAAVGPRGAVVKGDEGYAAVGRQGGAVVAGDDAVAARGRYGGAVVAGEEGVAARGRYGGVVVGDRYDDYDAWKAVAGAAAVIAVGTMLARPPATATTVVINGTTYWQDGTTYYLRTYSGGDVVYQVVPPPR